MLVYAHHGKSVNPIFQSLYDALSARGVTIKYFDYCLFAWRRGIVLVGFPEAYLRSSPLVMVIKTTWFFLSLLLAKLMGSRLVWVVNNLRSHESHYGRFESYYVRCFVSLVDAVIHYSKTSLTECAALFPRTKELPNQIIPHPNFCGVYRSKGDAAVGRALLSAPPASTVILCFGIVRRYKGIGELIEIFKHMPRQDLCLAVAGIPIDRAYADEIRATAASDARISLVLREISDAELPHVFAAADLACLNFQSILNSGSALLALSLGCPVVCPGLGSLNDLRQIVGDRWLKTYPAPLTQAILEDAVRWSETARPPLDLGWCDVGKIADQTLGLFESILARRTSRPLGSTAQQ
jgi:beta-1,4-mannosyltransferase